MTQTMQLSECRDRTHFDARLRYYRMARDSYDWQPQSNIRWVDDSLIPEKHREISLLLASTGSYTEEIGLLMCAKLLLAFGDCATRFALATQVSDEAKHSEAFSIYALRYGGGYVTMPDEPIHLLSQLDTIENPVGLMIIHTLLEGLALDQFKLLRAAFFDSPLGQIYAHVAKDEARHVAMGVDCIQYNLRENSSDEIIAVVKWCQDNIFTLAQVSPRLFQWLEEVTGESASDIEKRFVTHHQTRLDRMLQPLKGVL
jgi:hypothetical protein